MSSSVFALEIRLRGPARQVDTQYGTREERDELVRLELPVTGMLGWELVHHAVTRYAEPTLRTSDYSLGIAFNQAVEAIRELQVAVDALQQEVERLTREASNTDSREGE